MNTDLLLIYWTSLKCKFSKQEEISKLSILMFKMSQGMLPNFNKQF